MANILSPGAIGSSRLAKGRNRRILPVLGRAGEGRLTEPTAGAQPARRELVFMPQSGHSGLAPPLPEAPARSWGQPTRYDGVKADGTELAEGVSPRGRYRFPTGSPSFAAR